MSNISFWTKEENKAFETALAIYGEDVQWEDIAKIVPGKSMEDILVHYSALLDDIASIENDLIPFPDYPSSPETSRKRKRPARSTGERKKNSFWTEDEHRRFLEGLEKYKRGDWRSISRNHVVTKTPMQVASHAQKYFKRIESDEPKKRPSIHDISIEDTNISLPMKRSQVFDWTNFASTSNWPFSTDQSLILESQPLQTVGPTTAFEFPIDPLFIPQMPFYQEGFTKETDLLEMMGTFHGEMNGIDQFNVTYGGPTFTQMPFNTQLTEPASLGYELAPFPEQMTGFAGPTEFTDQPTLLSSYEYTENLRSVKFGDLSTEQFPIQEPVYTTTEETIVSVPEPKNDVRDDVTHTLYGTFIPTPCVKPSSD